MLLNRARGDAARRRRDQVRERGDEAWTYQATARAIELCRAHHRGADVSHFEAWSTNRAGLDEVEYPKKLISLADLHNAELAKHVPVPEVLAADTSLAAFRRTLLGLIGSTEPAKPV